MPAAYSEKMTYGSYLALVQALGTQHPLSGPVHHDEMRFIIQHETTEFWLKLVLQELDSARVQLPADDLSAALKRVARTAPTDVNDRDPPGSCPEGQVCDGRFASNPGVKRRR